MLPPAKLALPLLLAATVPLFAADWPQFRGPERTNVSKEMGLLATWPKDGPKLLWTFENAGIGFAGPAVVGDRLYTLGSRGGSEYVMAIDTKTGKELWATRHGPHFTNAWGDGPRSTPTVDGDVLYALGAHGDLTCLDTATGKQRWRLSLVKDLGGTVPTWGYSESPLVDGDQLIVTPGGNQGALAAIDKKSGKVIWRSKELDHGAAYSSAMPAVVGGIRFYIQMTDSAVVGVAARDGKLFWQTDLAVNGTAVCPTPIVAGDQVYVTSGYGAGCGLLKLTAEQGMVKAETIYDNKVMTNHHGGVVKVGEHIYGFSDDGGWTCQEFSTGRRSWNRGKLGKGSLTAADGKLYLYAENDGVCVLIDVNPKAWTEVGRFTIPRETKIERKAGKIWTHPVVANGKLYLRDQDLIFCFDVKGDGK